MIKLLDILQLKLLRVSESADEDVLLTFLHVPTVSRGHGDLLYDVPES